MTAAEVVLARGSRDQAGDAALELAAPVSGVVLRQHYESARPVQTGEPLLEIGDPAGLEIEVDVLSADAVRLREGMRVELLRWGEAEAARRRGAAHRARRIHQVLGARRGGAARLGDRRDHEPACGMDQPRRGLPRQCALRAERGRQRAARAVERGLPPQGTATPRSEWLPGRARLTRSSPVSRVAASPRFAADWLRAMSSSSTRIERSRTAAACGRAEHADRRS